MLKNVISTADKVHNISAGEPSSGVCSVKDGMASIKYNEGGVI